MMISYIVTSKPLEPAPIDLEQLLTEHIDRRGYIPTLLDVAEVYWFPIVVAAGLVAGLSWILRGRRAAAALRETQATARKLEGETISSHYDLLNNLETVNQELLDLDTQSCGFLTDLRNLASGKGYKLLQAKRDELCSFQSSNHMPKFTKYLGFCQQLLGRCEFRHRVRERFLPGAKSQRKLIQVLNSEMMIQKVQTAAPLKIRRSEVESLFDRMKSAAPWYAVYWWGLRYDIWIEQRAWKDITREG